MEDDGVLVAGGTRELRQPRREAAAGEVVRPPDVRLVAPLLVPDVDDGDAGVAARHGQELRRRHVRHAPRHPPRLRLPFPSPPRERRTDEESAHRVEDPFLLRRRSYFCNLLLTIQKSLSKLFFATCALKFPYLT